MTSQVTIRGIPLILTCFSDVSRMDPTSMATHNIVNYCQLLLLLWSLLWSLFPHCCKSHVPHVQPAQLARLLSALHLAVAQTTSSVSAASIRLTEARAMTSGMLDGAGT
jgi:hypothetical protein